MRPEVHRQGDPQAAQELRAREPDLPLPRVSGDLQDPGPAQEAQEHCALHGGQVPVQGVREALRRRDRPAEPQEGARRGAVPVQTLREEAEERDGPLGTRADAHGGEALCVQDVLRLLHLVGAVESAHEGGAPDCRKEGREDWMVEEGEMN